MPAPNRMIPRFLTMRGSQNGGWGYLQRLLGTLGNMGTATVLAAATSVVVTDANVKAGDLIFASVLTAGATACYVVGVTITAGTSFTINVSAAPGTGGAVIAFVRLPASLLFGS